MLIKISLIISLIGIILILILANTLEPNLQPISKITIKDLNKKIKVQGTIFNIKSFEESNFQIISIKDSSGKIDITLNKILDLKNNQELIVIGRITQYKKNLQIQVEKIILK